MDTKLKNKHKWATALIIGIILVAVAGITANYQKYYTEMATTVKNAEKEIIESDEITDEFLKLGYKLATGEALESDNLDFSYVEYQMQDADGETVAQSSHGSSVRGVEDTDSNYPIAATLAYDDEGNVKIQVRQNSNQKTFYYSVNTLKERYDQYDITQEVSAQPTPKDVILYCRISSEGLQTHASWEGIYYSDYQRSIAMQYHLMLWILLVAGAAIALPFLKPLQTGREKIFRAPFEVAVIVMFTVISIAYMQSEYFVTANAGQVAAQDIIFWTLIFALVYWAAACIAPVFTMGSKQYAKERIYVVRSAGKIKEYWGVLKEKIVQMFAEVDLSQRDNRVILKVVLGNFVILTLVCMLWFFGIFAVIIYSIILFFVLRKIWNKVQEKYSILLNATNAIAEGHLDTEITEDLGVFESFKPEIEKIQSGFKKAVEEEVKSQRMKTELITNVSHDLKTPLTAIITYVDLLKEEKDEEKRKEYIEVLDSKSMRLKVLIEDLFEVSKASSKDVKLDLMEVDVVNLFKQVKLELEDRIKEAKLELRCNYSEERLAAMLDSQKTYRIFENLLMNIIKYSLQDTRVYIDMAKEDQAIVVRMKNISSTELNFSAEEITERFVRGDLSRGTEGSGLGLAIVKSFTELQKGSFKIETEADLFKVELRFTAV